MRSSVRVFLVFATLGFGSILVKFRKQHLQYFARVLDTAGSLKAGPLNEGVLEGDAMADGRENELKDRIYRERVSYAMSQCYAQEKHHVENVLKHDEYKLAYCKVPKVGCTFWMRMLLYLYNDTGGTPVKSPFEIPRMFVHLGKKKHLQIRRDFPKFENQLTNYTRFMFARDPYSRLWSAYLDKFRLPDFWRSSAFQIVKRRSVMTDKSKTCRSDITFEEFLQFVATQSPQSMNEHWRPVSYHCDPCLFKPTVIGKVETFNDDAKYILRKIGYADILSSFNSETYVQEEITMLIDYNFDLLKGSFYKTCLTARNVSLLLWEVFQLNGYLPKEVAGTDAMKDQDINDEASFTTFVINFYKSASKEDKRRWKLQKAAALKDAFRTIPKSVTDKLVSIYKNDFNMFGYDSKPPAFV